MYAKAKVHKLLTLTLRDAQISRSPAGAPPRWYRFATIPRRKCSTGTPTGTGACDIALADEAGARRAWSGARRETAAENTIWGAIMQVNIVTNSNNKGHTSCITKQGLRKTTFCADVVSRLEKYTLLVHQTHSQRTRVEDLQQQNQEALWFTAQTNITWRNTRTFRFRANRLILFFFQKCPDVTVYVM